MRAITLCLCVLLGAVAVCDNASAETLRGGLFTIDYPAGGEPLARQTLDVLEAAQQELARRLPAGNEPIHVVVCGSLVEFRARTRWTQPSVEGAANPADAEIVVKAPPLRREALDYAGTLRHELVHVLLARHTDPAFLPRWFDEGIAMAVGRDFRYESMFRVARMYLQGDLIAYPSLDFAFFAPHTDLEFGDAYAQTLSMTRYLMDSMSEDAFWKLVYALKTTDFPQALRAATGLSPLSFYERWRRSLWKVALVASVVSGFSIFQVMAALVFFVFWRKYRRGRRLLRQWAQEEAEDEQAVLFPWELEDGEPPHPWEEAGEDE